MTGRSCNEVPVSLAIFQRAYRIIGWDAAAPCAIADRFIPSSRERERPFSILDRRGIFQFKGDNVPQIHRRGVGVDVYEFRSLGRRTRLDRFLQVPGISAPADTRHRERMKTGYSRGPAILGRTIDSISSSPPVVPWRREVPIVSCTEITPL